MQGFECRALDNLSGCAEVKAHVSLEEFDVLRAMTLTNAGTQVAQFSLSAYPAAPGFALSPDGNGGTDITFAATASDTDFWPVKG